MDNENTFHSWPTTTVQRYGRQQVLVNKRQDRNYIVRPDHSSHPRSLQRRLAPLRCNTIRNSKIRHQIARQELTWPRFPDLRLQILRHNLQILILNPRHELLDPRRKLSDQPINVLRRDRFTGIQPRTVFHPLPELYTSDFGSGCVFHEVVEWDTAVSANPGGAVAQTCGDIGTDTLVGDLSWDFGVQ